MIADEVVTVVCSVGGVVICFVVIIEVFIDVDVSLVVIGVAISFAVVRVVFIGVDASFVVIGVVIFVSLVVNIVVDSGTNVTDGVVFALAVVVEAVVFSVLVIIRSAVVDAGVVSIIVGGASKSFIPAVVAESTVVDIGNSRNVIIKVSYGSFFAFGCLVSILANKNTYYSKYKVAVRRLHSA